MCSNSIKLASDGNVVFRRYDICPVHVPMTVHMSMDVHATK
jgi:hypothetical protein